MKSPPKVVRDITRPLPHVSAKGSILQWDFPVESAQGNEKWRNLPSSIWCVDQCYLENFLAHQPFIITAGAQEVILCGPVLLGKIVWLTNHLLWLQDHKKWSWPVSRGWTISTRPESKAKQYLDQIKPQVSMRRVISQLGRVELAFDGGRIANGPWLWWWTESRGRKLIIWKLTIIGSFEGKSIPCYSTQGVYYWFSVGPPDEHNVLTDVEQLPSIPGSTTLKEVTREHKEESERHLELDSFR
jgi:hypothetical protein